MRCCPGRFGPMLAEPAPDPFGRASEPSRADLAPQHGGILAAFGKPRVQIREMRINDAVARSRRALGKLRRLGVFAHCSACQLHRAGNGEQSLAGTMAASYLLIEFQTPGAVVQANLSVRGAAWKRPGALRWQNTVGALNTGQSLQATTCAGKPALDRLAHVGQQMPSVRHLNRSRRPDRDAAGILARPVAGDNLDP